MLNLLSFTLNLRDNFQNYKNYNLPISMNPLDYNVLSTQKGISYVFRQFEKYNEVEIILEGVSIIKYSDHLINEKAFFRKIGNRIFFLILKMEFKHYLKLI